MDSRSYWAERSEIREVKAYNNCLSATQGLVNAYRCACADIRKEINDFYNRYANENGLDYAEAVKQLNNNEMLEWRNSVEVYIKEIHREKNSAVRERLIREYNARAYGARITRLESLSANIEAELSRLYARANEQFRELLGENFTEGYYRTIYDIQNRWGYSSMFSTVSPEMVENALTYPWSGANFSDRLWKHKGELLSSLRETLTAGFIRGESVQTMAKKLEERLNASRFAALRLIRTESSHIHNTAELEAYKACGFEEYEFMASSGERVCEACGGMDGKRIKLADKQFGVNFPPLHPNCRCTTIAYDPDDDMEDMKSGELDYDEWYGKYVEGRERKKLISNDADTVQKALTGGGNGGIINSGKVYSFEEYDADPLLLGETTPQQKYDYFCKNGNTVVPLGKGNFRGVSFEEGGGFRVFFKHNKQLMLMYHPEERSHHGSAYYKLSNGGKPRRFFLDGTEIFD